MEENIKNRLEKIAETDIFQVATLADNFVGYPFYPKIRNYHSIHD